MAQQKAHTHTIYWIYMVCMEKTMDILCVFIYDESCLKFPSGGTVSFQIDAQQMPDPWIFYNDLLEQKLVHHPKNQ